LAVPTLNIEVAVVSPMLTLPVMNLKLPPPDVLKYMPPDLRETILMELTPPQELKSEPPACINPTLPSLV
jgi:hypothetical protein